MGKWFDNKKKSEYMQRQAYIMTNLGLFYIIILALFAIPLLGTFVVILIKGVIDLRFVIVPVAMFTIGLVVFICLRGLRRWTKRIRQDGRNALDAAQNQRQSGQPVQISVFNGLFSLTFGTPATPPALTSEASPKQLLASSTETQDANNDVLSQLKELAALRKAGDIDDQEFELLKAQLIENTRRQQTKSTES